MSSHETRQQSQNVEGRQKRNEIYINDFDLFPQVFSQPQEQMRGKFRLICSQILKTMLDKRKNF